MNLYSNIVILLATNILIALLSTNHCNALSTTIRIEVNDACSDSDIEVFRQIAEGISFAPVYEYYNPGHDNDDWNRRNLRHRSNKDITAKKSFHSFLRDENNPMSPFDGSMITFDDNATVTGEESSGTSSYRRELWPLMCNDLCAGYVPKRCMVSRCNGFRRHLQRKMQVYHSVASHELCYEAVERLESLLNEAYYYNRFTHSPSTTSCVNSRRYTCILGC